jgi:hypothetical protein
MAQFEPLLWERHRRRRLARMRGSSGPAIDRGCEFGACPLGRLGRPLVAEVETYLAFFALARERVPEHS